VAHYLEAIGDERHMFGKIMERNMKLAFATFTLVLLSASAVLAQTQSEQAVQSAVRDARDQAQRNSSRHVMDYMRRYHSRRKTDKDQKYGERRTPDRG
jgi:hypothetical protein